MSDGPMNPTRRGAIARLSAAALGLLWLARGRRAEASTEEEPLVGEIRMYAGSYAPAGWAFCEGQLLSIFENDTLFQLIGTTYGGDGQTTFGLPDLRGRAAMHQGFGPGLTSRVIGETGGQESVSLISTQIPVHTHELRSAGSAVGTSTVPTTRVPAKNAAGTTSYSPSFDTTLAPQAMDNSGSNTPHQNMQPFLAIHFIISLYGKFPTP
jgi:microcystin-dependent protein